MKAFFRILLISILTIGTVSGCDLYQGNSIKPSKKRITRNYNTKAFTKISIKTVADVTYKQAADSSTSVSIYGPENMVDLMAVSVENNTLNITTKRKVNFNKTHLKIAISSPRINGLSFNGVGDVVINDPIQSDDLRLENRGVGDIKVASFRGKKITVYSSGVGNVNLSGEAEEACLDSKGVGDINASDLKAQKVTAEAKGVGDISCYATEAIHASAKGVGEIKYKGNPTQKSLSKKGIGGISHQ